MAGVVGIKYIEGKWVCSVCGRAFDVEETAKRHRSWHSTKRRSKDLTVVTIGMKGMDIKAIDGLVLAGFYLSRSEFIRYAVRMFLEYEVRYNECIQKMIGACNENGNDAQDMRLSYYKRERDILDGEKDGESMKVREINEMKKYKSPVQFWLKPDMTDRAKRIYDEHLWEIREIVFRKKYVAVRLESPIFKCVTIFGIPFKGKAFIISSDCQKNIQAKGYCNGMKI